MILRYYKLELTFNLVPSFFPPMIATQTLGCLYNVKGDRAELRTVRVRYVTGNLLTDSLVQAKIHPVTETHNCSN